MRRLVQACFLEAWSFQSTRANHCGIQKYSLQPWVDKIKGCPLMSIYVRLLVLTPSWTYCETYLPFSDEVTRSVRSSSQDLYAYTTTTNY